MKNYVKLFEDWKMGDEPHENQSDVYINSIYKQLDDATVVAKSIILSSNIVSENISDIILDYCKSKDMYMDTILLISNNINTITRQFDDINIINDGVVGNNVDGIVVLKQFEILFDVGNLTILETILDKIYEYNNISFVAEVDSYRSVKQFVHDNEGSEVLSKLDDVFDIRYPDDYLD